MNLVEASERNYRKLEVSVESMEVFTTSMEVKLHRWKVPSTGTKKQIPGNKFIFYSRNLYEDTEAFCHKL